MTNLLAVVLVLIHAVGLTLPGRMLCIPMQGCDEHPAAFESATECCESEGHSHGVVAVFEHDHPECGCHVHLPAPSDPVVSKLAHHEVGTHQGAEVPAESVSVTSAWPRSAARLLPSVGAPDQGRCVQSLVIRATRLNV
jgi:hypothetical protein